MSVFTNSRYYSQPILRLVAPNGLTLPTIFRTPPPIGSGTYLHYTVVEGDRFDRLAYTYYQDQTLWWVIADANPEVFYPDLLVEGSIIRIPQQS
jgi:hypothetical protein